MVFIFWLAPFSFHPPPLISSISKCWQHSYLQASSEMGLLLVAVGRLSSNRWGWQSSGPGCYLHWENKKPTFCSLLFVFAASYPFLGLYQFLICITIGTALVWCNIYDIPIQQLQISLVKNRLWSWCPTGVIEHHNILSNEIGIGVLGYKDLTVHQPFQLGFHYCLSSLGFSWPSSEAMNKL